MQFRWTVAFMACLAHFAMAQETSQEPLLATEAPEPSLDPKALVQRLVSSVRALTNRAKNSMLLEDLIQETVNIRTSASDFIIATQGQGPVSECDTSTAIKLAAANIGPHELLTGLLAKGQVQVLNARIAIGLAMLQNCAQNLEDESARSDDVRPQVAAVVFGAEAVEDIGQDAATVMTTFQRAKPERAAASDVVPLGHGFTATPLGPAWGSSTGSVGWTLVRSVRTPFPEDLSKRQWSGSLGGHYSGPGNWGVNAQVTFKF